MDVEDAGAEDQRTAGTDRADTAGARADRPGTDRPGAGRPAANEAAGGPPPPPWYRRGVVWLWFVVATVAGSWALSVVAEQRLYRFDVDPASAEAQAWCEAVGPLRTVGFWGATSYAEEAHGVRVEAFEAAAAVVPSTIRDDLAEVDAAERERQAEATALAARQEAGEVVSPDVLEDLEDEHRVALRRVEDFTAAACPLPEPPG